MCPVIIRVRRGWRRIVRLKIRGHLSLGVVNGPGHDELGVPFAADHTAFRPIDVARFFANTLQIGVGDRVIGAGDECPSRPIDHRDRLGIRRFCGQQDRICITADARRICGPRGVHCLAGLIDGCRAIDRDRAFLALSRQPRHITGINDVLLNGRDQVLRQRIRWITVVQHAGIIRGVDARSIFVVGDRQGLIICGRHRVWRGRVIRRNSVARDRLVQIRKGQLISRKTGQVNMVHAVCVVDRLPLIIDQLDRHRLLLRVRDLQHGPIGRESVRLSRRIAHELIPRHDLVDLGLVKISLCADLAHEAVALLAARVGQ